MKAGLSRAREDTSTWQKGTGNTDTIFLSNALPVTVTGSIWQEVSVCDTGNGVNSGFLFFMCFARATAFPLKPQFNHKELNWTNETPNQTGFLFVIILGLLVLPYGKKLPVILVLTNRNPVWFGGFYLLKQDFMSVTLGLELSLERKVTPQTKYSRTWNH